MIAFELQSARASGGQYHYTEDSDARVMIRFRGEALRVRYVGFTNGGTWQLMLNGEPLDQIESYAPLGMFRGTRVYSFATGEHTLELVNTGEANPASTGTMLAFDALQIYQAPELPSPTLASTPTLIPVQQIALIAAPPSPQPTTTPEPIQTVRASVVIGYDENANEQLDLSEGVRGISVRLVEVGTNRVVAQAFTDAQGFAQVEGATNADAQLVVPYFGEAWSVSSSRQEAFTLLLTPGNQPGLIP